MLYLENIEGTTSYKELIPAEYKLLVDKMKSIRPETKYYIIERGNEPDYISENNVEIINNDPRTLWTLEERTTYTVNFPEANKLGDEYVTTLSAWAVESVNEQGIAKLAQVNGPIAAQTPILLKSTTAGDVVLNITTDAGNVPEVNELKGPDYLIEAHQLKSPTIQNLFSIAQGVLKDAYDEYVAPYEYLMLKNSGTVNNKYMWGLGNDDLIKCFYTDDNGDKVCEVRNLTTEEGKVAFYNYPEDSENWTIANNKAFLVVGKENPHDVINFSLRGDINRDGQITIADVTALIDILLELPKTTYMEYTDQYPQTLDYEAADFKVDNEIAIEDVTVLIDYLLNM